MHRKKSYSLYGHFLQSKPISAQAKKGGPGAGCLAFLWQCSGHCMCLICLCICVYRLKSGQNLFCWAKFHLLNHYQKLYEAANVTKWTVWNWTPSIMIQRKSCKCLVIKTEARSSFRWFKIDRFVTFVCRSYGFFWPILRRLWYKLYTKRKILIHRVSLVQ